MGHSNKASISRKPHPDFPLTPRADGRWAKKVRGKVYIFAGTTDEALAEWLRVKDDLLAGRTPRLKGDGLTVEDLCDHFLNAKRHLVETGEITARTYADYFSTCERLVKSFGLTRLVDDLRADDFEALRASIAKTRGPVSLGNEIGRVRVVLKYGFDADLIDKPVRAGPMFKPPSRKVLRKTRAAKGQRMIEAADLRRLLAVAGVPLKSMILLAMNGGLGNSDIGNLPLSAIDLQRGWINFPRPKTGIARRFPLWPETIEALKASLAGRPEPNDVEFKGLAFVTKYGQPWAKDGVVSVDEDGAHKVNGRSANPISAEFRKLLNALNLHRPGLGFYTLRHVFETIAGESRDQVAVDHVMGHARDDMASTYRERISDERLAAVVEHVRGWLFTKADDVL